MSELETAVSHVQLSNILTTATGDRTLSQDIQDFVAAMPAAEMTGDVLKRQLATRFPAKAAEQTGGEAVGQQKSAEKAAPKGREPGM